jgi:hypothetical protein
LKIFLWTPLHLLHNNKVVARGPCCNPKAHKPRAFQVSRAQTKSKEHAHSDKFSTKARKGIC